jgi:hypothetical protein
MIAVTSTSTAIDQCTKKSGTHSPMSLRAPSTADVGLARVTEFAESLRRLGCVDPLKEIGVVKAD